ncbi:hypothetical protein AVEN_221151-1, partial [Araneus ventricosus]
PRLDQIQESAHPQKTKTIGERFIVKEESAASVGSGPWTPEGIAHSTQGHHPRHDEAA